MDLIDRDGTVLGGLQDGTLVVTPNPLVLHGQRILRSDLRPGETLAAFLQRHVDGIERGGWAVAISGFDVPAALWGRVRPKHGAIIECRAVAKKQVAKLAAVVALSYFTLGAGGLALAANGTAAGLFAAGGAIGGGFWVAAAAFVGGSLIINKLLAPKIASPNSLTDNEASPTYRLSGGNNRARQYEPIGLLFGILRVTPDFASAPFTFFEGEDQYLYSIFHAGINTAQVTQLQIGETAIGNYQGVTTRTRDITGMPQQELEGWGNVDSIIGAQLTNTASPGTYVTRTSSANAIALSIDLEASLYTMKDNGSFELAKVTIEALYRNINGGDWQPFFTPASGPPVTTITLESISTKPIRVSYICAVPLGQYEVMLRKLDLDKSETRSVSTCTWSALRTVQPDSGQYGGMGRYGIKIKASGQLNGALNEVSWLAEAKPMPFWTGSEWVGATYSQLSNPGAQMLQFARGIYGYDPRTGQNILLAGLGLADSMIDIESFKGFMVRCTAMGFAFDHWFDSAISCGEVLDTIAAVGLGAVSWQSGKLGVVWVAEDQPVEGVVNMATMKANTFGVNYQTLQTADSVEYAYFDRSRGYTWQTLRVSDPSVGTSLNPTRIASVGVTNQAHAALLARFHLAQSIYQRKDVTFGTDIEHLTYKRMSVLALTHDVTQWGYGGRLNGAINNAGFLTLTLDDMVPAGAGPRYIGLRIPGERDYRVFGVAAFTGESRTVTLTTPWPVGVPVPGAAPGNPAVDTIWIYDFKATPGYRVRVISIQPESNLSGATVTVVPDSPEFWNYVLNGSYNPPVSQSLLPRSPASVSNARISEMLDRQGNTFYTTLTVNFDAAGSFASADIWGSTAGLMQKIGSTQSLSFSFRAGLDEVWYIEVRSFDALGRPGSVAAVTHAVIGLREPPPDVSAFSVVNGALSWPSVPSSVVDLAGYRIRFHYGENRSWADASELHENLITENPWTPPLFPNGPITLMIKAQDTTGNESVNFASILYNFGDPLVDNLILTHDAKALGFPGKKTNASVVAGNLVADDSGGLFWGADNALFWPLDGQLFWSNASYKESSYLFSYAVGIDQVGSRMTLLSQIDASAYTIEFRTDTQGMFWPPDDAAFWPAGDALFWAPPTAWQTWPGAIEDAQLGTIDFRITMQAGPVQGAISELKLQFDVEDETEILQSVAIVPNGTRLPLSRKYRFIKIVNWNLMDDGGTAVRFIINDYLATGPLITAVDVDGLPVSALGKFQIIGAKG